MQEQNDFPGINVSLSSVERQVRTGAFRAIYLGRTPSSADLANDLDLPVEGVDAAIETLVGVGLMTLNESGRVTGSHGISAITSDHRLSFDVGERFVWCAVDAVGIPAAMGVDAKIESRCFDCGQRVILTMRNGEADGSDAGSLRIGVGTAGCTGKVIQDVCPMLNFFCSQEHADRWAASVGGATVITIPQAAEMGRRTWSDIPPA